jgi:hypothetical protein
MIQVLQVVPFRWLPCHLQAVAKGRAVLGSWKHAGDGASRVWQPLRKLFLAIANGGHCGVCRARKRTAIKQKARDVLFIGVERRRDDEKCSIEV